MVVSEKVMKESILPSVREDDEEGERNETLGGIASRPASRPRSVYSRGSVDGQRVLRSRLSVRDEQNADEQKEDEVEKDSGSCPCDGQQKERDCVITDEDYDIDLELDAFHNERQAYDPTGQTRYKEACKMLSVTPMSCFLRNINQSELNMMHCGLGLQGTKALAVSLVTNTSILKLNLRDNWMEEMGAAAIADMLKENCYITEIDLSENSVGEHGARALSSMLLENTTLVSLKLSGSHLDERAARHLAPALVSNQKLQHLDLSHNRFGDIAGEILGAAIADNTGMKSLNLAWNSIRGNGAIAFVKGLEVRDIMSSLCQIPSLNFQLINSRFDTSGHFIKNIFLLEKANIFLRTLDLSYNGLGKEGAKALEEVLKHNNTLEDLNISINGIPLVGAINLAMGLKVNSTLRILKMSRNPMQSAGCFAILKSVQANPKSAVEFLDFSDICVDQEFEDLFKTVKETIPNLQVKHGEKIKTELKKS